MKLTSRRHIPEKQREPHILHSGMCSMCWYFKNSSLLGCDVICWWPKFRRNSVPQVSPRVSFDWNIYGVTHVRNILSAENEEVRASMRHLFTFSPLVYLSFLTALCAALRVTFVARHFLIIFLPGLQISRPTCSQHVNCVPAWEHQIAK